MKENSKSRGSKEVGREVGFQGGKRRQRIELRKKRREK